MLDNLDTLRNILELPSTRMIVFQQIQELIDFNIFFLLFLLWYNVTEYCSCYFVGMELERSEVLNHSEARVYLRKMRCEFGHIYNLHGTKLSPSQVTSSGFETTRKETSRPSPSTTNKTSTRRMHFSVAAVFASLTAGSLPLLASITSTGGLRFLVIFEGLAAQNEGMLDGFSDYIAPDNMDCKGQHLNMYRSIYARRQTRKPGYS